MLDKQVIAKNKSRLGRHEVQELLVNAWLGRPEKERNQFAAERFVEQAARDFDFESKRPRPIVIRSWILPHVIRVEEKRQSAPVRWLNRPWFKRSRWPLRLAGLGFLAYALITIFWNLATGRGEYAAAWVPISAVAVMLIAIIWVRGNNDR